MSRLVTYLLLLACLPLLSNDSLYELYCNCEMPAELRLKTLQDYNKTHYFPLAHDSCKLLCEWQVNLAREIGSDKYEAAAHNIQARFHRHRGNYDSARLYYRKSMQIRDALGDRKRVAETLVGIGGTYTVQGNYDSAMWYATQAHSMGTEMGDTGVLINSLFGKGLVYDYTNEADSAYKYFRLSYNLKLATGHKHTKWPGRVNMGSYHMDKGDIDSAIIIYHEVLSKTTPAKAPVAVLHLGRIYENMGNNDSALHYYQLILCESERTNYSKMIAASHNALADFHLSNGRIRESISHAEKGLKWSMQVERPGEIHDANRILAEAHQQSGNFRLALQHATEEVFWRDSVKNLSYQKNQLVRDMQNEFNTRQLLDSLAQVEAARIRSEQIKAEEEALALRNRIQYSAIIIFVLLLGSLIAISGRFDVSPSVAAALIFIFFILLFEFLLVVMDPFVDAWSGGNAIIKLAINSVFALVIFFGHQYFEGRIKAILIRHTDT